MSDFDSDDFILEKCVLSTANTGHMINRKGGQPNQGICHKVPVSGQFECPTKNMTILAITTYMSPSFLIKKSGNNGSYSVHNS